MKFNIGKGAYVDKTSTIANVDGIPLYLGIFGDNNTGAAITATNNFFLCF